MKIILETYSDVFSHILSVFDFQNVYTCFDKYSPELGLWNPSSKASVLIQWLWKMEPPVREHVNRAIVRRDLAKVKVFGPFV